MATKSVSVKNGNATTSVAKNTNKSMMGWIKSYEGQIAKALPSAITPERFSRIAMTAVTQTPKLGECTPQSFIGSLLTAAQLGLEPNTPLGQAYLIPYYNSKNKCMDCQFQLGYRGLIELAHRSNEFKDISAHIVYENDEFEYELGLEPKLRHIPALGDRGDIRWVYAVYHLKSEGYGFEVMSYTDIENHRKKTSQASSRGFSPWTEWWEEMAKKTVIKRALKYAPLATEFVKEVSTDESKLNFEANGNGEEFEIVQERVVEADVSIDESADTETGEIKELVK